MVPYGTINIIMALSVWSFLLLCQLTFVFGNKWDCAGKLKKNSGLRYHFEKTTFGGTTSVPFLMMLYQLEKTTMVITGTLD